MNRDEGGDGNWKRWDHLLRNWVDRVKEVNVIGNRGVVHSGGDEYHEPQEVRHKD